MTVIQSFYSGTLHTLKDSPIDIDTAARIKDTILKQKLFKQKSTFGFHNKYNSEEEARIGILNNCSTSMEQIRKGLLEALITKRRRRVHKVLSAYADDRPFSLDLVGAVIRQCSFIDKMDKFGWTKPGYFDHPGNEVVLYHAIARYHAFLDLMASTPKSFLVPTLDIDLAWHTHQMMGARYADDCLTKVGRFIDHDDKVEETYLANSFDSTCRAWEQHFNVPYMHCGCPPPEDGVKDKLNKFALKLTRSRSPTTPRTDPLQPPRHQDALAATHASEHNSVTTMRRSKETQWHHDRLELVRKRREYEAKKVREGKVDVQMYERGEGHDAAFLYPVPFSYYPPILGPALRSDGPSA